MTIADQLRSANSPRPAPSAPIPHGLAMLLGLAKPYPLPITSIRQQLEACQIPEAQKNRMLSAPELRALIRESLECGAGTTSDVAGYCGTRANVVRAQLEAMARSGEVIRTQREGTAKLSYVWSLAGVSE